MNTKKQKNKQMIEDEIQRLLMIIDKQERLINLLKDEVSDLSCKLSIYRSFYFKFDKDR